MSVGQGLGGATFKRWAGPLPRTCTQKGRGSTWKGGPLECEVPEFGGRALPEGVWVGLSPSALEGVSEGVSECRGGALGGERRGGTWALRGRREALRAED